MHLKSLASSFKFCSITVIATTNDVSGTYHISVLAKQDNVQYRKTKKRSVSDLK